MKLEETIESGVKRVTNVGSVARLPGFESWFLSCELRQVILTNLCLSFLICEIGIMTVPIL